MWLKKNEYLQIRPKLCIVLEWKGNKRKEASFTLFNQQGQLGAPGSKGDQGEQGRQVKMPLLTNKSIIMT